MSADISDQSSTVSDELARVEETPIAEDDKIERAERHYFADLLVFQVEKRLFRVPVNILTMSAHFKDMFDSPHVGEEDEGQSDDHPILLSGITAMEMEHFLDFVQYGVLDGPNSSDETKLEDALHLATMWGFKGVRDYAIFQLEARFSNPKTMNHVRRIVLSDKCNVTSWRKPAYIALCDRSSPLTYEEGCKLGWRRSTALWQIREKTYLANKIREVGTYVHVNCNRVSGGHAGQCPHADLVEGWSLDAELKALASELDPA